MPLPAANILASETSPYLLQHAGNPVHWRPWGPAALAEARETGKPILVSVGYAACHWCHVMAHESFENSDVADVMNSLFVNIKIDREERPDLDQIFMAALTATGEQGGWPLTMFLTPDGKPFWGGTYFPREARYGRPGFVQVLNAVYSAWSAKTTEINDTAATLAGHIASQLAAKTDPRAIDRGVIDDYAERIGSLIDREKGGIRGAPKFPNAPLMNMLRLAWLAKPRETYRQPLVVSLAEMLKGGIYDHIGGGLSRYSTDSDWLVPHFEKMLYDNAQLIDFAGWAYAETGDELFRVRIEETISWLLREMRVAGGGFASSLDADSEGEEGLFYTWDRSEIESILGPESEIFLSIYRLFAPGEWHGKPIVALPPRAPVDPRVFSDEVIGLRHRLREAREGRIRPGRDGKVLVDWNGLAIAAIARAARQFERRDWLDAAIVAYRYVDESRIEDGRLPHSISGARRLFPGLSSDYAAMIDAALSLYEATGEPHYLESARRDASLLERWYGDGMGSHFLTASDAGDVPIRIRGDVDEATPSATAQIIVALSRLAMATGSPELSESAQRAAEAAFGRVGSQDYGQAGILSAAAVLLDSTKLITVDRPGEVSFARIADSYPDPRRFDIHLTVGSSEPEAALPGGVKPDTSRPGAWLCTAQLCLPFIAEEDGLARAIRRSAQAGT